MIEIIFWVCTIGYVLNELQQAIYLTIARYFGDNTNYFDSLISIIFVAAMVIRIYCIENRLDDCDDSDTECSIDNGLNNAFSMLWCMYINIYMCM